ncbi:glucose-6-phosphate isomerase [uncultured Gammaproteobacteria bacterium]
MSRLTGSPAWQALAQHRQAMTGWSMRQAFANDPDRFRRFSLDACGLMLDYSKNLITDETLGLLLNYARQQDLEGWRNRMLAGERINTTEDRAVLHVALRNRTRRPMPVDGVDVMPAVRKVIKRMKRFVSAVRFGAWTGYTARPIKDVVTIGIGGSDLGPFMVCNALRPYHHPDLRLRFVSNVDGTQIAETLGWIDPQTTLFIIASKTFTTQETMANALAAREWFLAGGGGVRDIGRHFVAVTANTDAARDFGIDPENMFEFWDWVGGRFSMWSAIGLPIALAVGMEDFEALLIGAHEMDEHFRTAPLEANMPMLLGLLGLWNINFWNACGHAIVPYDEYLSRLPAYLQQLEMESNGKSIDRDGQTVDYATAPVIFGEPGTNSQHAFFQLLHQGTQLIPTDFIASADTFNPVIGSLGDHQRILLANLLAQSEALMRGLTEDEARAELTAAGLSGAALEALLPHKVFPGNKPSNTLFYGKLTPFTLGALIALYEHKVFVQGILWNINSFDQWGVELGKKLAKPILADLSGDGPVDGYDSSTAGLIQWLRERIPQAEHQSVGSLQEF